MIKLIVLDLDGTALKTRSKLHPETIKAVEMAHEKSIKVIIATGRSPQKTYPFAQQLKIFENSQHIICYNGANIINLKTGDLLVDDELNRDDILEIISSAAKCHLTIWGYGVDSSVAYILKKNLITFFLSLFSKRKMIKINEKSFIRVYKFLIYGQKKKIFELQNNLKKLKIEVALTKRKYCAILEITCQNANKKNATQFLSKMWKIESSEILAIGDGANDYELLKWVGCSVAMANSCKEVIDVAKNITSSNKNGGVGKAINKYVLNLNENE